MIHVYMSTVKPWCGGARGCGEPHGVVGPGGVVSGPNKGRHISVGVFTLQYTSACFPLDQHCTEGLELLDT